LVHVNPAGSLRAASAISTGTVEQWTIEGEIQAVLSKLREEPASLKRRKDRRAIERYRNLRDPQS
jgi:hypothetical protein